MRNLCIGLALCLLATGSALADDAEAIFAKAFAYTVQVRTSIQLGFVEDEQGGKQLTLTGTLPAAPAVLQRRGLLASGMLLAPLGHPDLPFLGLGHDIGIHDLVPGSAAEANELSYWDLVSAVDDQPVENMAQLHALLLTQAGEDVMFEALRRRMEITAPEWITVAGERN